MSPLLSFLRAALLAYFSVSSFAEVHELGKLQGTWIVTGAEVFHFTDNDGPDGSTFVFRGNRLTTSLPGGSETVKLNVLTDPREMDLIRSIDDLGNHEASLCIFQISADRLRICFGGYEKTNPRGEERWRLWPRPNPFEFTPHSFSYFLKRQEP